MDGLQDRIPTFPRLLELSEIITEDNWHQGSLMTNDGKYCVLGHLFNISSNKRGRLPWQFGSETYEEYLALKETLAREGTPALYGIGEWNDKSSRTVEEVKNLCKRAAFYEKS